MNIDLIITLKTVSPFVPSERLSQHLTSFYTAIAYDYIRHIMLNELCEVDINLPNASDEKLVNILFCYSLEYWSLLNVSYDRFKTLQQIYYLVWELLVIFVI